MHDDGRGRIPKIVMDTSGLPDAEQFAYWAAHSRGARLHQAEPGPFLARGDLWNLGALQLTLVEVDPFIATRDRALVNATDSDYIQIVHLFEGDIVFETEAGTFTLAAPVTFVRDYSQPSTATSSQIRCLILYFARDFLQESVPSSISQGPLDATPELDLLRTIAMDMIQFFPNALDSNAALYATILRDLAATALLRAGTNQRASDLSSLAMVKAYIAAQPPGTLSVAGVTDALGMSRSAIYRLFEHEGGLLAYDRTRRLRALYRAVCNPLNTSTLFELAGRYGFRDQAALARSFRKAFGCTPKELRQRKADIVAAPTGSAPLEIQRVLDDME